MSEGGIDYGGIVTAVIAAAAVVTIVRCLYAAMVAIARCLYAAMIVIARSLYGNTKRQQESFGEHEETEDDEETEEADNESWEKPEIGWVKLNVDGSRDGNKSHSAGCGGALRDASATWLRGFAKKLNPKYKVHQTELEAILTGLEVVSEMNVKKLIVESDNDSVVRMVEKGVRPNHPDYHVVELIRTKKRLFDWEVTFVPISKKANRVAHRLANDARKLACDDVCEYGDPPANCVQLLLEDEIGCQRF